MRADAVTMSTGVVSRLARSRAHPCTSTQDPTEVNSSIAWVSDWDTTPGRLDERRLHADAGRQFRSQVAHGGAASRSDLDDVWCRRPGAFECAVYEHSLLVTAVVGG
jgi:hypothetical protein